MAVRHRAACLQQQDMYFSKFFIMEYVMLQALESSDYCMGILLIDSYLKI